MISKLVRQSYYELALTTRVVMFQDFGYQYALRSEIRNVVRGQLNLMPEAALIEEIRSTTNMLRTSVVQARWSEETGAHKLMVRPEMLKSDGSTSELTFLTPEEVNDRLSGKVVDEIKQAVGCKVKAQTN